jgi:hypothetical protein
MSSLTPKLKVALDAYDAACGLVPRDFRHNVVPIGGAVSIT